MLIAFYLVFKEPEPMPANPKLPVPPPLPCDSIVVRGTLRISHKYFRPVNHHSSAFRPTTHIPLRSTTCRQLLIAQSSAHRAPRNPTSTMIDGATYGKLRSGRAESTSAAIPLVTCQKTART